MRRQILGLWVLAAVSLGWVAPTQAKGRFASLAASAPGSGPRAAHRGPTSLDPRTLSESIAAHAGGLSACYTRHLKRGARGGSVLLRFDVRGSGQVAAARLSQGGQTPLGRCVLSRVAGWNFPRFRGAPLSIEVPLSFTL
jgi:TonB family protein